MSIDELLESKQVVIADGAWGTQLTERGLEPGDPPESWVLTQPETVRDLAAAYVAAGAEIVLTNTFGGSRLKLAASGLDDRVEEINRRAAELSTDAANGRALVYASVGPTGKFMEPLGTVSEEEMVEVFTEQIRALVAGGADGILIETMTDLGESKAALRAAREHSDGTVVTSMTFDRGPKGYATMMGVTPDRAAEELQAAGADVVGANCGQGIENIIEVISLMSPVADRPVWAKPNAGMPHLENGRTVFDETPEEMVSHFDELVAAGARIVGGCCGTTPEHIRALVKARDEMLSDQQ